MNPTRNALRWWKLSQISGFGPAAAAHLLDTFCPLTLFDASFSTLVNAGLKRAFADQVIAIAEAPYDSLIHSVPTNLLRWLEKEENHLIAVGDVVFPERLMHSRGCPLILHVTSHCALSSEPGLAIVGSRRATNYGLHHAFELAGSLSQYQITVVSGLARGIDTMAHRGALNKGGCTWAVLGTGVDCIYPKENKGLAQEIVGTGGALISEFNLGSPARAHHFPRRNRIIAGLSDGCLVVEAAIKSGSLITARLAAEMGREVMALPGLIDNDLAKGTHNLIREGACLVDSAGQIAELMGVESTLLATKSLAGGSAITEETSGDNGITQNILKCLSAQPESFDSLREACQIESSHLQQALFELELAEKITLENGWYMRC